MDNTKTRDIGIPISLAPKVASDMYAFRQIKKFIWRKTMKQYEQPDVRLILVGNTDVILNSANMGDNDKTDFEDWGGSV